MVESAPEPKTKPKPVVESTPEPVVEPTSEPTPSPESALPRLAADHVPIKRAAVGTTKSVVVRVKGPANTSVTLYYGPPGGPHQATRLDSQGDGVYKGSIIVGEALGKGFEYWVLVKNKRTTPRVVALGSQSKPYTVTVL